MDRRELPDRAAHSPEERLLLSRVWDKCEQCRTRNIPTATGVLSPAEQAAAQGFLVLLGARESGIFWGGYDGAERRRLVFLPDWLETPDDQVAAVRAACRSGGDLTNIGGESKYSKTIVCPDGCVMFRFTANPTGNENFYKGKYFM